MQQSLYRTTVEFLHAWKFSQRGVSRDFLRFSNTAAAIGRQERVKINSENVINATLSQSHQVSTADASVDSSALPLLDSLEKISPKTEVKPTGKELLQEKSPLPFEDVPGPAVLKLWEKYWKYVPLFGTQLFRSALINGLTEGRLLWNRNITPIRYLFNEYGPIVRINGPLTGDIVLIHRPEHIAKVFEQEGDTPSRSGIDILQHYRQHYRKYRFAGPFCAQGSQAAEWLEVKKNLTPSISEQVSKQFGKLEITCDELIQRIRQIKNRQDEVSSNFYYELSRWGMECFWVIMLNKKMGFLDSTGYNESSEASRFIEALNLAHIYMSRCETGFQVWRFLETHFSKKLYNSCDVIDGIIGKYIRLVQNNARTDLLSPSEENKEIRSSVLENLLVQQRMSPDDVSTVLMDMIILGVQATINSQAFLLYYLAKNPRVQKNLFDEIIEKVQKTPNLTRKTFEDMPYLNACVKECLRLRPPFPYMTRLLPKTITLHGYKIPKGTYLIMANQLSSLREENFEDPNKFKPERWLKSSDDIATEFGYLPFGKGLRICNGESIAKLQMMLLTTKIIREFRIEYDYADIGSRFLIINVPDKPLRFRFIDRD